MRLICPPHPTAPKGGQRGVKGGVLAPLSANPACARPDKNLGGECILRSDNMETARPLEIGNLRNIFAWGEHFPQIANRSYPVCHGDMAPTGATPTIAPLETNLGAWIRDWRLGLALGGLDKDSGAWTRIVDLGLISWGLEEQSVAWHRLSRALAPLSGAWMRNSGFGFVS